MKRVWAPWRMTFVSSEANQKCIFCLKPKGSSDRENLILHRGKTAFVMMNAYPYNNGHMLISPYRHLDKFENLSDEEILEINALIKKAIGVVRKLIHPHGFNIGVNQGKAAGSSFDHIHFHLLPRWNGDTNFMPALAGTKVIHEHLNETYRRFHMEFQKIPREP